MDERPRRAPPAAPAGTGTGRGASAADLRRLPGAEQRIRHVEHRPARPGDRVRWPAWVPAEVVRGFAATGVPAPWTHQVVVAEAAWAGRDVVVATGTASGKSLAYQLPVVSAQVTAARTGRPVPTAVYLSPTKALAADQRGSWHRLGLPAVRAATYDGDTEPVARDWIRAHATVLLTNPDMLHRSVLPEHERFAPLLRRLAFVVVDECHHYRGLFGSHVALVLRRLLRVAARYGADPVVIMASATVHDAAGTAARLAGRPFVEVSADGSARGPVDVVLWEPAPADRAAGDPPTGSGDAERPAGGAGERRPGNIGEGDQGWPVRRSALGEAAGIVTGCVLDGVRTVAFVRSRRAAEALALSVRRAVDEASPGRGARVAAYRGGYLPEERRALEARLRSGDLLAVATTTALELGIDVSGLDASVIIGYPGTRAGFWQQAGRAGRDGQPALAVLVARDDPLDTYLVHHPQALFGQPVEATVLDPTNPYVLAPHLAAAAAELPLRPADLDRFPAEAVGVLAGLERQGLLRRRSDAWYWSGPGRAADLADIRGAGGPPVRVVEAGSGALVGTVDRSLAERQVHPGAVHLHQGRVLVVDSLDLDEGVALVEAGDPGWSTTAREVSTIGIVEQGARGTFGPVDVGFGTVEVASQVVGYLRRSVPGGEVIDVLPLDLPQRRLRTQAVWYSVDAAALDGAGLAWPRRAGAAHAAEHAAIGLLPLVASCDRWDIGGVSTPHHPDTGRLTVFVHDAAPGGAGFAQRGHTALAAWLAATRDAVGSCGCADGCPACVQSPKCGNGNEPLDKAGSVRLLDLVLAAVAAGPG